MKKLILTGILFLVVVLFLSSKADAQTKEECEKTRDRASYNCLLEFGKCYSPCVAKTKDNTGCRDSCKQVENACDKQVDADYKTCLEAIKKDSENPSETNASSEVQTNTDCHGVFTKESNACLKESTECIDSCVDKGTAAMSLTVDGGKVMKECTRSVCDPASKACNDKTEVNFRACLDARDAKKESAPEVKKETPAQDKKGVDIFKIFELFKEAVLNLEKNKDTEEIWTKVKFWEQQTTPQGRPSTETTKQKGKLSTQAINDWIMENDLLLDPARLEQIAREKLDSELYGRTPQMTEEIIKQYKEEWNKKFEPSENQTTAPFRARTDILKGEAEIKYPGSDEWVPLKQGDVVPLGATLFTGMDTTLVFSIQDKGVFQMLPFSEITVSEENIKENSHTDIKLDRGEIEVSIPGGVYTGTLQVTTPSSTTSVRGTHFWVSYDKNKRVAVTGVYEGKVEMKDTNGVTLIAPSGGKPGIAVVMQKLSTIRLAVIGMVLAVAVGSVIWFLKKKTIVKSSKK